MNIDRIAKKIVKSTNKLPKTYFNLRLFLKYLYR